MQMEHRKLDPLIITVAPNGARKTKQDHPAIPLTANELAEEAYRCMQAGASMIHLHVRDDDARHVLDVGRYQDATLAIKDLCGDGIIIQATTEAVGMYTASEQMAMVRGLRPESASLAISELVPEGEEADAGTFFRELAEQNILQHYILYSAKDLLRFQELVASGVIPEKNAFLLFVLGRYSEGQTSRPEDLMPFLQVLESKTPWAVCAFGALEHAAASTAIAMGGHVRVGFENNMFLKNGDTAKNNADLVTQVTDVASAVGRSIATADEVRRLLR